jgi:hypothetical protein
VVLCLLPEMSGNQVRGFLAVSAYLDIFFISR